MRLLTGYDADDFARNIDGGWWTDETFGEAVRAHAAVRGETTAVVDGDRRYSWNELSTEVDGLASGLASLGLGTGDRVSVQLPNCLELVTSILAIWEIGAVYQPLNPMYRRTEMSAVMGLVRPAAIICPQSHRGFDHPDLADEVATDLGCADIRIIVGGTRPGWINYHDLANVDQNPSSKPAADALRVALLGTTSGTTGDPKVYIHIQATQFFEATVLNEELGIRADDVFLAAAPITHRGALMYGMFTSLVAGATLVLGDARFVDQVHQLIEREQITTFMAIPTMVTDLLDLQARSPRDMSSLSVVVVSGAPVTPDLIERFVSAWPQALPSTGYGLSETGWCTVHRPGDPVEKLSSSGRATPGMELEIRDETGSVLPTNETGEIHIRGPMVCAGYFDNQRATEASIDRGGWFASGDLGYLDTDGFIHPVGRSKHMIIRGGLNIYAEEIERLLEEHPAVEGAIVLGLPDERLGERACACVALEPDTDFDLAELRRFFEDRGVAQYTWPEQVEVLSELPRNPIGKLDRLAVARRFAADS